MLIILYFTEICHIESQFSLAPQLVITEKERKILIYEGHYYSKNSHHKLRGLTYWRCIFKPCRGSIKSVDDDKFTDITITRGHTHCPYC